METIENIKSNHLHLGKKIERLRRLRGMTQTELGQLLGITKQAVSKMEQTEKIDDERLEKIASASSSEQGFHGIWEKLWSEMQQPCS